MRHVERERSNGAEHRDTVLSTLVGALSRTVIFAVISLAAWWGCSNVASADEAEQPTDPTDVPEALEVNVLASALGLLPAPSPPVTEAAPATEPPPPALRATDDEAVQAAVDAAPVEPVLVPGVVLPLLAAVEPVLGPANEVVEPVLTAVTTPLAPVVQSVVPVVDAVAAPLLAPVAVPLVAAVAPLVERTGAAVAPIVGLVAPAVVPLAKPVVALVAPALAPLTKPAAPFAAGRFAAADLRPSTLDAPADAHLAVADAVPTDDVVETATATAPAASRPGRAVRASTDATDGAHVEAGGDAIGAAPLAPPRPAGAPFRPAAPTGSAVVMAHGGPDVGQRDQRFVAVLSPAADVPGARLSALSRTPVVSPLARFGGRPPVTPD